MPPSLSSENKLECFLTDFTPRKNVSASTQNQAVGDDLPAFERAALLLDLEEIANFTVSYRDGKAGNGQLVLL